MHCSFGGKPPSPPVSMRGHKLLYSIWREVRQTKAVGNEPLVQLEHNPHLVLSAA
jgi:hypothetical protein